MRYFSTLIFTLSLGFAGAIEAKECENNELVRCFHSMGLNGAYDVPALDLNLKLRNTMLEKFIPYIKFVRISKRGDKVQLQVFLEELEAITLEIEHGLRLTLNHKAYVLIEPRRMSDVLISFYPNWFMKVLPRRVQKLLWDVNNEVKDTIYQSLKQSVRTRTYVHQISYEGIEITRRGLFTVKQKLNRVISLQIESKDERKDVFLMSGRQFLWPITKGLVKTYRKDFKIGLVNDKQTALFQ